MTEAPKKMDDEKGNCNQCGHPFDPHQITADPKNLASGGKMTCPVEGCKCFSDVSFDLKKD
jgi:hypothetical protein